MDRSLHSVKLIGLIDDVAENRTGILGQHAHLTVDRGETGIRGRAYGVNILGESDRLGGRGYVQDSRGKSFEGRVDLEEEFVGWHCLADEIRHVDNFVRGAREDRGRRRMGGPDRRHGGRRNGMTMFCVRYSCRMKMKLAYLDRLAGRGMIARAFPFETEIISSSSSSSIINESLSSESATAMTVVRLV